MLTCFCAPVTWAPIYQNMLVNISLYCLQGPLQHLPLSRYTLDNASGYCPLCDDVVSCIQGQLSPVTQAAFSSSQVFLGVTPTLLSLVAPTIGELNMLSSNRPLLSFLISLGAPSTFCFRMLTYDDPLQSLVPVRTIFTRTPFGRRSPNSRAVRIALSLCEYLFTGAAVGNVIHASWTLGPQTILSWKCQWTFLPFVWTTLSFTVHIIASQAWLFSHTMRAVRATERRSGSWGVAGTLRSMIEDELTLSATREKRAFLKHRGRAESRVIVFSNILAQAAGLILILFGTFVLSGLMLIGARDALYFILRFLASGAVSRIILMFEISGMAAVENEYETLDNQSEVPLQQVQTK